MCSKSRLQYEQPQLFLENGVAGFPAEIPIAPDAAVLGGYSDPRELPGAVSLAIARPGRARA